MLSIEHFCGYLPDSFTNVQHSEKNVLICWLDGSRIKVRVRFGKLYVKLGPVR